MTKEILRDNNGIPLPKMYGALKLWEHNSIIYADEILDEPYEGDEAIVKVIFLYDPATPDYKNEVTHAYVDLIIRCRYPNPVVSGSLAIELVRFFSLTKDGNITTDELQLLKQYVNEEFNEFVKEKNLTDAKNNLLKLPEYELFIREV